MPCQQVLAARAHRALGPEAPAVDAAARGRDIVRARFTHRGAAAAVAVGRFDARASAPLAGMVLVAAHWAPPAARSSTRRCRRRVAAISGYDPGSSPSASAIPPMAATLAPTQGRR